MTERRAAVAAALLVAASLIAYLPALRGSYVWDDDAHVTANETLRSAAGLKRIWLDPAATPQYYPLVHTTFWIEHRLWGSNPGGYHAVNVLLHAANALLIGLLLRRLSVPGAALAAWIFALHPVHVESVAWITERKNVLSTFFYLAAALVLLDFFGLRSGARGRQEHAGRYAAGFLLFLGALASKTVTASLPAALALVILWKRQRVTPKEAGYLAPMAAAGTALGALTVWLERHHVGATGAAWDLGMVERVLVAGRAAWFYAWKLLVPWPLSFIYPRWSIDRSDLTAFAYPVAALAFLGALWSLRRRIGTGPLVALLFFWGTLFPALGFFNVFPMRYSFVADHFQYLASIGAIALFASATRRIAPAAVAVVALLGALTYLQAGSYHDAETLWRTTLTRNPAAPMAHNNLGLILAGRGELESAAEHYRKALAADPRFAEAEYNLGNLLVRQGRAAEALPLYEHAASVAPDDPRARYNLGVALLRAERFAEAAGHLDGAVRAKPEFAAARGAFAFALVRLGRDHEAAAQAFEALRIDASMMDTRYDLADALVRLRRFDEAILQYRAILARDPGHARARFNLGLALLRVGRRDEAVAEFDELLRKDPGFAAARAARDAALSPSPEGLGP